LQFCALALIPHHGFSTLHAQKAFSQKATAAITNGQSFYLYNNSFPFDPYHPTGDAL
jgi:hypothetical protein